MQRDLLRILPCWRFDCRSINILRGRWFIVRKNMADNPLHSSHIVEQAEPAFYINFRDEEPLQASSPH